MDDQAKFGEVFHRLSFGEAIERKLLTDYQVASRRRRRRHLPRVGRDGALSSPSTVRTSPTPVRWPARSGWPRRCASTTCGAVISFHSRVSRAREFAADDACSGRLDARRSASQGRTLVGATPPVRCPRASVTFCCNTLRQLDDGERGLLANARCLAEGVDVPALDGVAFIDPRRSEVDIVQAVGRAIRQADDKTVGTIVIPVFIDTDERPRGRSRRLGVQAGLGRD